jgi:hypothetical protein
VRGELPGGVRLRPQPSLDRVEVARLQREPGRETVTDAEDRVDGPLGPDAGDPQPGPPGELLVE